MSLRGNRTILRKDDEDRIAAHGVVVAYGTLFYTREFVIRDKKDIATNVYKQ